MPDEPALYGLEEQSEYSLLHIQTGGCNRRLNPAQFCVFILCYGIIVFLVNGRLCYFMFMFSFPNNCEEIGQESASKMTSFVLSGILNEPDKPAVSNSTTVVSLPSTVPQEHFCRDLAEIFYQPDAFLHQQITSKN